MSLGSARREREYGIFAIQGLNGRLLIDAKHCGMLQGLEIKADDVGRLGF
jgi:hypothetical protein